MIGRLHLICKFRTIQKYLEDPVAEEILRGEVEEGGTILADYEGKGDVLTIKVKKGKASKESKDKESSKDKKGE